MTEELENVSNYPD